MFDTIPDDMSIHFTNYKASHLCVSTNIVLIADALLHYHTCEYMYVGQLVGVPLPLPVEFVFLYREVYINFNHVLGYV